ncbi:MAG: hypothetical protein ABIY55_09825, partial [Kofleriaceae bacterium]
MRATASVTIGDATNALLASRLSPGAVVAMYSAKGSEVETARIDGFAHAQGWRVAYPRLSGHARSLTFHAVSLP